jgi:hypothetical protein
MGLHKAVLGRKSIVFAFGAMLLMAVSSLSLFAQDTKDASLKSHLTLYVGEPLLSNGGTVVVASIPLPETEWRALEGANWAADDPDNRKRPTLGPNDILFGASITERANFVEMYYPENGTFGFDFVVAPGLNNPPNLRTERISIGSGGWTHWASRTDTIWPDVSVIHIEGASSDKTQSRVVSSNLSRIMNLGLLKTVYAGANIFTPTAAQLSEGTFGEVK